MSVRRAGATASLALAALFASASHALGIDVPYARFETADAVDWVQLCGRWGPDHQGTYRVIHASHAAQSFLYVQWMRRDPQQGDWRSVHTLAIAELNNDHAEIALADPLCRATPRGIVVTARATSGHDDTLRRVTIEVGPAPGQYRWRAQRSR